jgi:two-component system nitrate/nitrite response regulator NarL
VLIADQDGLARRMIQTAVQDSEAVAMVTTAGNTRDALELALYYRPLVLIVDTALPPRGGVELVRKVLTSLPETRIITVSAVPDDATVLEALRAGAVGHVGKDIDPDQLPQLVVRAARGEAIVPRRLIMDLLEVFRDVPESGWRPLHSRLTTREWQIIELLENDTPTELIAGRLNLSRTTVYTNVKSLMRKLGVHSRRDAVAAANRLRRAELLGRETPMRDS